MRAAPAVSVRGSGGVAWRLFQAAVPALAASALIAWGLGLGQLHLAPALWAAPVVGAVAWWLAPRTPQALAWDGQCWRLDGGEGSVELMIDLGGWLLLRFRPSLAPRRRRWVAVCRSDAGPALHGLRTAVYCRPPEPTSSTRTALKGSHAAQPD